MSMYYYIGENFDVFISNEYWYSKFIEWAYNKTFVMKKKLPNLLDHHPFHGNYELEYKGKVTDFVGSIEGLVSEIRLLQNQSPPEYAVDIMSAIIDSCNMAIKNKLKITLDDGVYDRSLKE